MAEELQSLIEKINRDGVEKAAAEAERIVSEAKKEAATMVAKAKEEAASFAADAQQKADESAERAKDTIRQAARDAVIAVEKSVTRMLEKILCSNVNAALSNAATAATIAGDAVKDIVDKGEVSAGANIVESLRAQLAAKQNFTVVLDETLGTGFTVKVDGGRVEHDFTGATIAAEIAKRLRPDLAKAMSEA